MRLNCTARINVRPSSNSSGQISNGYPRASMLSVGRRSGKNRELELRLICAQDMAGNWYKVTDIERVFTRFAREGKATLRMKKPLHDIVIKAEPTDLQRFLNILKLAHGNRRDAEQNITDLSNLDDKVSLPKIRTKICIKNACDYPVLEGFPTSTRELSLHDLKLRTFDRQILKLKQLSSLDLSVNLISRLPPDLGNMANLAILNLSSNKLDKTPPHGWNWLESDSIRKTLRDLDISCNQLTYFPRQIGNLKNLVTLRVTRNQLVHLPQSIGNLRALRHLYLEENNLVNLPGSIRRLRLESIHIIKNKFNYEAIPCIDTMNIPPSLREIAGQTVLKQRKTYNAATIPRTVCEWLDSAKYCCCGGMCMDRYVRTVQRLNLGDVSRCVIFSDSTFVPIDCFFCSKKCVRRYAEQT